MSSTVPRLPRGDLLLNGGALLVVEGGGHVGADESRGHGVGRHFASGELTREALGESDEAGLAGGVVRLAGIAHEADDAGHVDDAGVLLPQETALERFHRIERAFQIRVHHGVPVFIAHAQEQAVARHAGVVHQDFHLAEVGHDLLAHFRHCCAVGHVHGVGFGRVRVFGIYNGGGGRGVGLRAAHHGDFGSGFGQKNGDGLANATARSGDDCDFISE
jgi:hypothetical protein